MEQTQNNVKPLKAKQGIKTKLMTEEEVEIDLETSPTLHRISISLYMWEFGQNNSKIDSGSKLRRFGFSSQLRIGQSFPGIVLSSEAKIFVSPSDSELVQKCGISAINCSWNKLDEIPFGKMGRGKNQRILPLLFAANSVNYGKPYKMNTAEAMAACLYITGYKNDAQKLLEPFSYGPEFLRLNYEFLESYSSCNDNHEVSELNNRYLLLSESNKSEKEVRKQEKVKDNSKIMTSYINEDDMPPVYESDSDGYENDNEDEIKK